MPANYKIDLRPAAPNHLKNPLGNGRPQSGLAIASKHYVGGIPITEMTQR
jgi:hypothetical protein